MRVDSLIHVLGILTITIFAVYPYVIRETLIYFFDVYCDTD